MGIGRNIDCFTKKKKKKKWCKCAECWIIINDQFPPMAWNFNFWKSIYGRFNISHLISYITTHQTISLSLSLPHTHNTNIEIENQIQFSFTMHCLTQDIINFLLFLLNFRPKPWYLIFYMKLILVWLVLIHQVMCLICFC